MDDINDIMSKNLGLIYTQLKRFQLIDDQDAESTAYEALYKAVLTYKADAGTAFSTYATCVIANALRMHLRKMNKKRQLQTVSYYTPISETAYLVDVLVDTPSCEDNMLKQEKKHGIAAALSLIASELQDDKQRAVLTTWQDNNYHISQQAIADTLGISRAYVNRILGKIRKRLKEELEDYV